MPLRPYQMQAVRSAEHELGKHLSTLVSMATGTGKTYVFCTIAARAAAAGWKVLVLAHREELCDQATRTLLSVNPRLRVGRIAGPREEWEQVTVAMVQSMSKARLANMDARHLVITDEGHHASAPSYQAVYAAAREVYPEMRHLGFTATPYRSAGSGTVGLVGAEETDRTLACFDSLAFQYDLRAAMDDPSGPYLVPEIMAVRVPTGEQLRRGSSGDYAVKRLNSERRNARMVSAYRELCPSLPPAIAFCVDVAHAKALAAYFRRVGIPSQAVYGAMDSELGKGARAMAVRLYKDGRTRVLTTVAVLAEGFDAPETRVILMGRPTNSLVLWMQMLGRVTRQAPGKNLGVVLDFTDTLTGRLNLKPAGLSDIIDGEKDRHGAYELFRVRRRARSA